MYTPRARVDCCLKRIGKCKTRIEAYQKRTKLGSGDMWGHFCIFIGHPESTLFSEDDVMCQSCYMKFPELTIEELHMISLGKYQMEVGKLYYEEHLDVAKQFKFLVHNELPGLIRVRLQSRFSKRQNHLLWIEFEEFGKGRAAILDYYCCCKSGNRTTGCCSHVAAVLRYLGRDRFLPLTIRTDVAGFFLDAAEALAEDSEEEDEDDWEDDVEES